MKYYKVCYWPAGGDVMRVERLPNRIAAWTRYKELCVEHERFNVDKPVMELVPQSKSALMAWLNERNVV